MANIALSVTVDRNDLGLSTLDINDHVNYYVSSNSFLGATVSWQRTQVTSPFLDGSVTVTRNREQVTDNLSVEVLGTSYSNLMNNLGNLIDAFTQDTFNLQVAFSTSVLQYMCEAADYTVQFDSSRWIGQQVLVTFSIPRNPVPITGRF